MVTSIADLSAPSTVARIANGVGGVTVGIVISKEGSMNAVPRIVVILSSFANTLMFVEVVCVLCVPLQSK